MNAPFSEKYRKMQERFGLPRLTDLRDTFKFNVEDDSEIDEIRMEISERIFSFTERTIEPIIAGSESFACLFEEDMLTGEERQQLFNLYKNIQSLKWENNLLTIKPDEHETAKWIRKTWDLWNSEAEMLTRLCKKLSSSWKTLKIKNEKAYYQG